MAISDYIDENVTDEVVKKKLRTIAQKRSYITKAPCMAH